jgi:hypothetical protein
MDTGYHVYDATARGYMGVNGTWVLGTVPRKGLLEDVNCWGERGLQKGDFTRQPKG